MLLKFSAVSLFTPTYLRFSIIPVQDIQRQLYLDSEEFVFAMFETMVWKYLTVHNILIMHDLYAYTCLISGHQQCCGHRGHSDNCLMFKVKCTCRSIYLVHIVFSIIKIFCTQWWIHEGPICFVA